MRKQRFITAATGTLTLSPPAPVSAATVTLYTPGGAVLQASASATVSAISTTLAAAAASGSVSITLTSVSGITSGKRLWLGGTTSAFELVEVSAVNASTKVVTIAERLRYSHDNGGNVYGSDVTYALTTTHTATVDANYRAVWSVTYRSDSSTASFTEVFDVVRQVFRLPLSELDLVVRIPESIRRSAWGIRSLADLITAAEEDIIGDLEARAIVPDRVQSMDQFRPLGVIGCRRILLRRLADTDSAFRQAWIDTCAEYDAEIGRLMANLYWYDESDDQAVDTADEETGTGSEENSGRARYIGIG